jgi:hypothetical protein
VLGLNSLPWLVLRASSDNGKWNERPSRVCCHTCARNEFHSSLFTRTKHPSPHAVRAQVDPGLTPIVAEKRLGPRFGRIGARRGGIVPRAAAKRSASLS